jgi:ubiquinone/menaquinone biosynthesis C-methylase UbiE
LNGTASVRAVYDRTARIYDLMQAPMDWFGGDARRRRVIAEARGRVLEVGIGTGANLELYLEDVLELVGVDISAGMLRRAEARCSKARMPVRLQQADVEVLPFADRSFDTVTATCVFCSVDDPVAGLRELGRVVKPAGRILLLEHVRPERPLLGSMFDALTPLVRRLMGPEINRRTEENVRSAGLTIVQIRKQGIWREIEATAAGFSRRPSA